MKSFGITLSLAEKAKDDAIGARNTAAENSGQAEQLYATFLAQYESIDTRLTALERKLPNEQED